MYTYVYMYHIECWTMLDLKNSMMAKWICPARNISGPFFLLRNPMNPELPVMAAFWGSGLMIFGCGETVDL